MTARPDSQLSDWVTDVDRWIYDTEARLTGIEQHPEHPTDVNAAVLHRLAVLEAELAALKERPCPPS